MFQTIVVSILAFGVQLIAAPKEVQSLTQMTAESELIVGGEVIDVEISDDVINLRVLPRRVLKGPLDTQTIQAYLVADPPIPTDSARDAIQGKFVLLFLNYDSDQAKWRLHGEKLLVPHELILAADAPDRLIADTVGTTPLQRVILEVASFYAHEPSRASFVLLFPLAWRRVERELAESVFHALHASGNPEIARTGLSGLAHLGSPEAVRAISGRIGATDEPDFGRLFSVLERSNPRVDDDALRTLIKWAASDRPELRVGAVGILSQLRQPLAVVALGQALHDNEFEVRWRAIGGLAVFANNINVLNGVPEGDSWQWRTDETMKHCVYDRELVHSNEAFYLGFWRDWWAKYGAQIETLVGGE
jgi:hypothetical protein